MGSAAVARTGGRRLRRGGRPGASSRAIPTGTPPSALSTDPTGSSWSTPEGRTRTASSSATTYAGWRPTSRSGGSSTPTSTSTTSRATWPSRAPASTPTRTPPPGWSTPATGSRARSGPTRRSTRACPGTRPSSSRRCSTTEYRLPDATFSSAAAIDLGDRIVELAYPGRGHTSGDIAIRVPDADVVFAGDLIEQSAPPSFGGDCFPLDWPATLDLVIGMLTDARSSYPGHGTAGGQGVRAGPARRRLRHRRD